MLTLEMEFTTNLTENDNDELHGKASTISYRKLRTSLLAPHRKRASAHFIWSFFTAKYSGVSFISVLWLIASGSSNRKTCWVNVKNTKIFQI